MQVRFTRLPLLVGSTLVLMPLGTAVAQSHDHPHPHHHVHGPNAGQTEVLTIADVLALQQNQAVFLAATATTTGISGDDNMAFEVIVTSKALPKEVFEMNPFAGGKRTILNCAHGGFAYDSRSGKGEVYWFLQGAGIIRIGKDRSNIELVETDPKMLKFNMHNATFFVHKDKAMIAWPANSGASVFITDVEGKLLHTIAKPTMKPYSDGANYAPTDTAYLDGKLWVTDGYASKFVMSYDLDAKKWTGTIFGGRAKKAEPGKFGTNHGITIHKGLIIIAGRAFARIHKYKPDTSFVDMFPLPDGSKPCDFEFFALDDKLYGVACSLNASNENKKKGDKGAAIYIVNMATLKIISTIKPKDELGLGKFAHLHNVFPSVDDGAVTLFCQAWNGGDFAVLRRVMKTDKSK